MKVYQLRQIIKEEIKNVIDEPLTVTNWEIHTNPNYIQLELSNGETRKIIGPRQTLPKSSRTVYEYQKILNKLNKYKSNPMAKKFIDDLINKSIN